MTANESRGRPAKVTVESVLAELNQAKKRAHADKQKVLEREKKLLEERAGWERRAREAEHQANLLKDIKPPTGDEIKAARVGGMDAARRLLTALFEKHVKAAKKWEEMDANARKASDREARVWAHPFVGQVLRAAETGVQELKKELDEGE
jgi:hypothetical protein